MENLSKHIENLKNGDPLAFKILYDEWSIKLYNFILRVSYNDTYSAEETVQAIFVKIWEIRTTLDPSKDIGSFMYTIARNMLINTHRRKMREMLYMQNIAYDYEVDNATESENIVSQIDVQMLEEMINYFIDELPPMRKKIFLLSRKSFMTNKQIAEELDISINTVESQMTKSLTFLREKLGKFNPTLLILFISSYSNC